MNKLILLTALIFITFSSFSQQREDDYLLEHLNVSNGLSNNSVTRVVKDHLGQLWFASSEGIVKLDIQGFEYFKPSKRYNEFFSEDIETLELGADNILWVGTKSGGLSAYDIAKDQFTSYNHYFKDYNPKNTYLRITSLKETSSGFLYIGTWSHGFFVIDLSKQKVIYHKNFNNVIPSIIEVNDGNIWFGSGGNLLEYNSQKNNIKSHPIANVTWITNLTYDNKRNIVYFGTAKGYFQYHLNQKISKKIVGENSNKLDLINSSWIDNQGRLWVGTWKNGLFRSNPEKSQFKKIQLLPDHEINNNYEGITDIFIDNNGVIWVTTTHGGVVKLIENRGIIKIANSHRKNVGFADNNINSIYIDTQKNQWIGTKNGGIAYKKASDKVYQTIPVTNKHLVSDFKEINGKMYVCTSNGLYIFSIKDPINDFQFFGSRKFRKIKAIYLDTTKNKIWFGLQQNGIAAIDSNVPFNLDKITYYAPNLRDENYFDSDRVEYIIQGKENTILLGTYHGLFQWNTTTNTSEFIDLKKKFDFPSNIILSLYSSSSRDTLFVGSAKGLLVLDNSSQELKSIGFYDKSSGLGNDCINAITLDNHQNLWLGLSKGISSINLNSGTIQNYTSEDGVSVSSINIGAVFNANDLIYFGGQKGMLIFSPQFINSKKSPPSIYFSKLNIDNKDINVGDSLNNTILLHKTLPFTNEIDLTYKEKVIRLDINTNEYYDQKNINFYYRVSSISDQWINNQHATSITFTQLPVGKNSIEIKGCRSGECGDIQELIINVSPAPWLSTTAFVFYILIILLIIWSIFLFFIRKEKLENKVKLINLEKEKEHEISEAKMIFFTNISHEIRTPLTLIHSPLEEILEEEDLPQKYRSKLQIINKNANSLLVLVNQLLDFRKIENNKTTLSYQYISLKKLIENKCWEFQSLIKTTGLQLDFDTSVKNQQLFKLDQEKIEIVINNLISNAIKFTPQGKKIKIYLEVNTKIIIRILDEGIGIKKADQERIFQRYYQGDSKKSKYQKGTGIGLSLAKNFIKLHGGDISVKSEINKGSEFIIELPIIDSIFEETSNELEERLETEKQNSLLIVDDNNDILQYLESIFIQQYNIQKATNGVEALKIVEHEPIDLIISDVMMPVMDGLSFCKEVKNDPELQNIPLLLLTANATAEKELEGLGVGANDFLSKPFNSKIIKEKVRNLLAYKAQLLQFYKSELEPINKNADQSNNPKPLTEDEIIIQKAVNYIEVNIDNDELNVDLLANHMCMSQSTLYRKLKSLTNNTIVGFIRSVRLKKAAQLLLESDQDMKFIAETVGINDLRYFNKEFKKQYGIAPSLYKKEKLTPS